MEMARRPWKASLLALLLCAFLVGAARGSVGEDDDANASLVGGDGPTFAEEEDPERLKSLLNWAIEHSDPDKLKKLARDRGGGVEWSEGVSETVREVASGPSEADLMREALVVLADSRARAERERALDVLEDLVTQIDNAGDFLKLGGLAALLGEIRREGGEDEGSVRARAAVVLGTAASNNPEFQARALAQEPDLVRLLLGRVRVEPVAEAKEAAVFALSSVLRNSIPARNDFYRNDGPAAVASLLGDPSSSARLNKKLLALSADLLDLEAGFEIKSFSDLGFARRIKKVFEAGDDDAKEKALLVARQLASSVPGSERGLREAGLGAALEVLLAGTGGTKPADGLAELAESVLELIRSDRGGAAVDTLREEL